MLEQVALTRSTYFNQVEHWQDYDVLTAVEDCYLLGRSGWLITPRMTYSAIVVDCSQPQHSMNGIMADTNLDSVGSGWLVLK